jgi:HD-GYP domain-containing protein (c-di-GMP phosphodiesterase class II)
MSVTHLDLTRQSGSAWDVADLSTEGVRQMVEEIRDHGKRIHKRALQMADVMKVDLNVIETIRIGAVIHDIGKLAIPTSILTKLDPLTDGEWSLIRSHPVIGEQLLAPYPRYAPGLPIVRHHHERWDGLGYPDGLAGEEIPIAARIVAACDAFDAMTTNRTYSAALSVEEACKELLDCAGTQFDPICANVLVELVRF